MNITGMMVYYYFICHRKLWYFVNQICMEQNSELVSIGKVLDEATYVKERKGILIDNTINIDFIKNGAEIYEIKKSKSIEEAGIWQVKFYMYYLEKRGVKNILAKINYPLLKQVKTIELNNEDRSKLDKIEKEIEYIVTQDKVPKCIDKKFCKKCSYFDLCYV